MKATSSHYSCQANRSQKKMSVFLGLFFLLLFMLFQGVNPEPVLAATILYVDVDATGANDGTSWTNAYIYLQDALDQANANGTTSYEIWVAEGAYYPDEDNDGGHTDNSRNEFFQLNYDNVQLYGGFAGSETQRSQRDWAANVTVLSGDIDKNDTNTDGNNIAESYTHIQSANAYHVLYFDGVTNEAITSATVLDGFTITAGRANIGWNSPHRYGGGLYCAGNGGACNPSITNVVFIGNLANYNGGAMYNNGRGSGNDSSPSFFNVAFINNSSGNGGTLGNDGGFGNSMPSLVNVTFANNTGAAIFSESYGGNVHVNITNTIMWGNDAQITGYRTSQHTVKNSIVQGSGGSSNWSAGDITTDAGGNLDADPLFTDAANGDATIQPGSAAVNTGDNADLPADSADVDGDSNTTEAFPYDLAHTERIYDGTVDMGAYEKGFTPNQTPVATDDAYSTDEDNALNVAAPGVLANDNDPDGDPITPSLVTPPDVGSLTFNGDGSFDYTPPLNYSGIVTFTYVLTDTGSAASTGTFEDSNQRLGSSNSRDVALGDLDGDGDDDALVANSGGAAQTVWLNDGSGNFSAHPTTPSFGAGDSYKIVLGDLDGNNTLDAVVANYSDEAETVWLNDGSGNFSAHPTVPSFGAGNSNSWDIALGDLDGDTDLDAVVVNTAGQSQTVWLNDSSGGFSAHPTTPTILHGCEDTGRSVSLGDLDGDTDLDALITGYHCYTFWLNDGSGNLSTHPTTPSITPGPNAHIGSSILGDLDGDTDLDFVATGEDGRTERVYLNDGTGSFSPHPTTPTFNAGFHNYDVKLGDVDADGDLDALVPDSSCCGTDRTVHVWLNDGAGNFSLHPDAANFGPNNVRHLAVADLNGDGALDAFLPVSSGANQVWFNQISWTASDAATVSITVNPVNDAPLITEGESSSVTMDEDGLPTPFALTLHASDADGDTLTWSINTQAGNGTASASGTSTEKAINYTPDANFNGSDSFVVQVSDGALTDTITVNVTVEPQNDAPTANDDTFNVLEDSTGNTLTVLSNDDIAPDTGETLAITAVGTTSNGGSVINNGSDLSYDPAANFNGSETFTYTVSDGNGGEATATVTVTVTAEADAPLITEGDSTDVTMDEDGAPTAFALTLHASDAEGDTITWSIDTQAGNGTASASGTGTEKAISYTPDVNFNGSDSFIVQVSDGVLTDTITVNVTINPQNDNPTAENDTAATTDTDPVTIPVLDNDSDVDGDSLSISNVSTPGKGTAVISGNEIIYTPNEGFEGTDIFTYTVIDGNGGSDTAQVTINGSLGTVTIFLPFVANNFANAPDLVVANLSISGSTIEVTIENSGDAPVTEEFWVDLYINPDTPPTGVNEIWELLGDEGIAWGVTSSALPLGPGESLTLTIGDIYYDSHRSNFSGTIAAGSTIYAQVDSANTDTTYGGVLESHEISGGDYNNIISVTTTAD